jgi:acyl-CoA thioesterase
VTQSRFEHDTAIEHVRDGRYRGEVVEGWSVSPVGSVPNGGYLLAMAARAMREPTPHPDPITITAHYLAPPQPGGVDIDVEVVRSGRRHSTIRGQLHQDGKPMVTLLGAFGDLSTAQGPTRQDRKQVELPPPEECEGWSDEAQRRAEAEGDSPPSFALRFERRTPPGMMGWSHGSPVGRGQMGGWIRWPDGDMDTLGLLAVADAYPPAVFNSGEGELGWVPTLELTVQVRKRPARGWLASMFTTDSITAGYLEEDGEVWDADGDLVVLSRQLALAARPGR